MPKKNAAKKAVAAPAAVDTDADAKAAVEAKCIAVQARADAQKAKFEQAIRRYAALAVKTGVRISASKERAEKRILNIRAKGDPKAKALAQIAKLQAKIAKLEAALEA